MSDRRAGVYIPSHTLLHATVTYDFGYADHNLDGWQAQVNATNPEDEYDVTSCQGATAYCGFGNGRMVLGTITDSWR